jgi:hypothetical protein
MKRRTAVYGANWVKALAAGVMPESKFKMKMPDLAKDMTSTAVGSGPRQFGTTMSDSEDSNRCRAFSYSLGRSFSCVGTTTGRGIVHLPLFQNMDRSLFNMT